MAKNHLELLKDLATKKDAIFLNHDIIPHVEKHGRNEEFYEKVILVKDDKDVVHIVGSNFFKDIEYHSQIAWLYMQQHKLSEIHICGGGEIKRIGQGHFEFYGQSMQFKHMNSMLLRRISQNFNVDFSFGQCYRHGDATKVFEAFTKKQIEEFILDLRN